MPSFQVARTENRLTLTMPVDARRVAIGCAGFGTALICLGALAVLALLHESAHQEDLGGIDPLRLLSPAENHFGFLWLLGSAVLAVTIPFYLRRAQRSGMEIVFDRESGLVTRNGAVVTRVPRIEYIRLHRTRDSADRPLYRLSLSHDDGCELQLDESYDPDVLRNLADEMADYLGVEIVRTPR